MDTSGRGWLSLWLIVSLAWFAGCAGTDTAESDPEALALPSRVVIVAAMNADQAAPDVLEGGFEPTRRLVMAYLMKAGFEVKGIGYANFRRLLQEERQEGDKGIGKPVARMLERLVPGEDDALMILPALVLRQVSLKGRGARWDGAMRTQRVRGMPDGLRSQDFRYNTHAISLKVQAWNRLGELEHLGFGGIELTEVILFDADEFRWSPEPRPESELFKDKGWLMEGVRNAFQPLVRLE